VAVQLAASQEGLSSRELVSCVTETPLFIFKHHKLDAQLQDLFMDCKNTELVCSSTHPLPSEHNNNKSHQIYKTPLLLQPKTCVDSVYSAGITPV
jgi:hypothetical protein